MSILIKGMEMPTSCGECKFFAWKRGVGQHCAVDDRITFHATIDGMDVAYERSGACPLIPISDHGRLIDADALMQRIEHDMPLSAVFEKTMRRYLHNAPTIIPASEEDE